MLGPFGLIILAMLSDDAPALEDMYQQFVGKRRMYMRVAHELCIFVVVCVLAYQTMVLKRKFMIIYEVATTGTSPAQIINRQNASSGMWAFSEGLEVLYLMVLFYLLWPICFNAVGHLLKLWTPSKSAKQIRQCPADWKSGSQQRKTVGWHNAGVDCLVSIASHKYALGFCWNGRSGARLNAQA